MFFQTNLQKEKNEEKEDEKTKELYRKVSDFLGLDKKGIIAIDIYDVKAILKDSKKFIMAMGEDESLAKAFSKAIEKEPEIKNATSLLINIFYPQNNPVTSKDLIEFNEICKAEFKKCVFIKRGEVVDNNLNTAKKITILATFN
jgi:cell division GTPase FtsZ